MGGANFFFINHCPTCTTYLYFFFIRVALSNIKSSHKFDSSKNLKTINIDNQYVIEFPLIRFELVEIRRIEERI